MDGFAGPSFHSARWDHDVDLKGKRVAVIGTGASAVQFVPEIASDVAELDVFQRTPHWFVPRPALPRGRARWHAAGSSGTCRTTRTGTASGSSGRRTDGLLPAATVDESWTDRARSRRARRTTMLRELLTACIMAQFADRPDLLEKVVPQYPPAAKRIVLDNGSWAATLKRDNVTSITDRIERDHAARRRHRRRRASTRPTCIIYGTGFQASTFLTPMKIVGRGGIDLDEQWDGDARAYLGITVPELPELLHALRPEHEHRRQRQHHLLLRVRGAVHPRLPAHAARGAAPGARLQARACTTPTTQRIDAANLQHGVGRRRPSTAGTRTTAAASRRTGRST